MARISQSETRTLYTPLSPSSLASFCPNSRRAFRLAVGGRESGASSTVYSDAPQPAHLLSHVQSQRSSSSALFGDVLDR